MTDRGILFSAPMVLALLAGTKTQTRRIINLPDIEKVETFVQVATERATGRRVYEMKDKRGQHVYRPAGKGLLDPHFKAPHAVGDRLWVRESWRTTMMNNSKAPRDIHPSSLIEFEASRPADCQPLGGKRRPGMFMPRWASRLTLKVLEDRIERLQDITDADAIAEGIEKFSYQGSDPAFIGDWAWKDYEDHPHAVAGFRKDLPVKSYRSLWGSINGAASWVNNPWVTVTTFEVIHANIADVLEGRHDAA